VDNTSAATESTGTWQPSEATGFYGTDSVWGRDGATFTWVFTATQTGQFDVSMWWTTWPSRSSNIPVDVNDSTGTTRVFVNQLANGGVWNSLGTFSFVSGEVYEVTITAQPDPTSTSADAVKFTFLDVENASPTATIDSITPNPADAGQSVTFTGHGTDTDGTIAAYSWSSSINGTLSTEASFSTSALSLGTHTITFRVQDDQGAWSTDATDTLVVSAVPLNVASQENGGVVTASSTFNSSFPVTAVNDGLRTGSFWNDATANVYPDWVQVAFNGSKTINEIDVFTLQDGTQVDPTLSTTFSLYGITAFTVQYWTGSAWATVPGGNITGNNLVWRKITFAALTTTKIRVQVNSALLSYSRICEIEAYAGPTVSLTAPVTGTVYSEPAEIILEATASASSGTITKVEFYNGSTLLGEDTTEPYSYTWADVTAGSYTLKAKAYDSLGASTDSATVSVTVSGGATRLNVAAAANGGVATASSTFNSSFPVTAVNDGLTTGSFWNDATANVYPDWVQVTFDGSKTITEVDVFTLQDGTQITPTPTMTFSSYGITAFTVQYWTGSAWVTVPGGTITGNNLVWRKISFAALTTDRIRVQVSAAMLSYSRICEIEAYAGPTVSLTSPVNGTLFTTVPSDVTLEATATASGGGSITLVEFYNGATLLGSDNTAPYTYTWTDVTAGTYSLTARAYDSFEEPGVADSTPVTITVGEATNVAAASNGGVVTASSTFSSSFPLTAVNDGSRIGSFWNDATANAYPDWVQVAFSGSETINEIDVFTLQDGTQVDPTLSTTFSLYGITSFTVQYWTGSAWATVTGGTITGNNLVWRKITFSPIATTKIRVQVNAALLSYSRITEIEAYSAN
jgi:hypothetical protein